MRRSTRRWRTPLTLALVTASMAGCGPSGESETVDSSQASSGQEPSSSTVPPESTSTRVALPGLFTIMAGLQEDVAGLERGLWREDFDSIGARATAIAEHPRVPAEEAQAIATVLGPDMAAFGQHDTRVHDQAVRIRELAGARELDGILAAKAELERGCVGCHTQFRERLREGLR